MRWKQLKTDVELTCKTCPQNPPFPPPQKIAPGPYWVRIRSDGGVDPMCWDCFDELTQD